MDAKPMAGEGPVGGGLAGRRNVPCPTLVKQENMDGPMRTVAVPNGFPGGSGVCPPRGNRTSNFNYICLHAQDSLAFCEVGDHFWVINIE